MKERSTSTVWFPFWADKWIFGSVRIECTLEERAIWIDLLSFASKDNGHIRANEETPYPLMQLSGMLIIPEDKLKDAIEKFIKIGKLKRDKNNTLYIVKWDKYQFSKRHKRQISEDGDVESDIEEIYKKTAMKCPAEFSAMATKNGVVRVSRLIVAVILNRPLKKGEEVHHINKNERDNKPENLMLFKNHADHTRYEHGWDTKPTWNGSVETTAENITAVKTALCAKKPAVYNTIQKNKKEYNKDIVLQIISHLNEKAKTNYSPKTKITTEYINGRIADGFKLDDFFYVIDVKCEDWIGDLEMEKFLRPKTLFATSNFEGYLNQKRERKSNHGVGGQGDNKKISALFEKQKREGIFNDLEEED